MVECRTKQPQTAYMLAAKLLSILRDRQTTAAEMELALQKAGLVLLSRRFRTMDGWWEEEGQNIMETTERVKEPRRTSEGSPAATANECAICMARPKDTLLRPCNHLAVCAICANAVANCPICRVVIEDRDRVFVS